ncbi:MAG: tRNA lysidine(34) synthetase TilS [Planctomycetota bacterium]
MLALADLQQRAARCFARYEYLPAAPAVMAAVSGGVDSSVLALVLSRLGEGGRLPGPLILAHVDHRQHAASAEVLHHVATLSRELAVGFCARTLDLPLGAAEDELRRLRYAALLDMALECDAGWIVTAHHADDDLETVLFRLLRGTGLRGLTGIPEHRQLAARQHVLRPFLDVRRADLERVAHDAGLRVCDDPSNLDRRFARNALRHELIPELRARIGDTKLDATLFALARSARAAAEVLDAQARRLLTERCRQPSAWRAHIDTRGLDPADDPFLLEALTQLDLRLRPHAAALPRSVLMRAVHELRAAPCGRRVHGLGAHTLLFERTLEGLLVVDPERAAPAPAHPIAVAAGEAQRFGDFTVTTCVHGEPPLDPAPSAAGPWRALLDLARLPLPWRLRRRRSGDRFHPLGMAEDVDLRRFMQARHIPRFDRDRLPLLEVGDERIAWVPGGDVSAWAALRPSTTACVEVRVELG